MAKGKYFIEMAKIEDREKEEWMTVVECIGKYCDYEDYPSVDCILAMLGIEAVEVDE